MKLKKLFILTLSILFIATLSAQTKKVATNKLIKTLEKNKKTGVTFVSDPWLKFVCDVTLSTFHPLQSNLKVVLPLPVSVNIFDMLVTFLVSNFDPTLSVKLGFTYPVLKNMLFISVTLLVSNLLPKFNVYVVLYIPLEIGRASCRERV